MLVIKALNKFTKEKRLCLKRTALVLGAGGFIGSHMVKRLKSEGYWVRGVDLNFPEFSSTHADEFVTGDLRDVDFVRKVLEFKGDQGNYL